MNPNIGIKSFTKPQKQAHPTCHVCGKMVRFPAKCDNCGNVVCNRHRPAFVTPWYCSKCREMWAHWAQNNPIDASGAGVVEQVNTAEILYSDKRVVEAGIVIDKILDTLMNQDGRISEIFEHYSVKGESGVLPETINTNHGDTVNG